MRRRKAVLIGFVPLLLMGSIFVGFWVKSILDREALFRDSERRLQAAIAEIDASDPGWRWADLVNRQSTLPDEQNLVVRIREAKAKLDRNFQMYPTRTDYLFQDVEIAKNQLHDPDDIAALEQHQTKFAAAVKLARALENYPKAFAPVPAGKNPFVVLTPFVQETREVVALLKLEVERLALVNRPAEAMPLLRSMLTAAGAPGEESFLIGNLARNAFWSMAASSVERLLALTEPGEELRSLLEPMRRATRGDTFRRSLRGERAQCDGTYCFLADDPEAIKKLLDDFGLLSRHPVPPSVLRKYEPIMKAEHASEVLRWTALLQVADAPLHERWEKVGEIEQSWPKLPLTLDEVLGLRDFLSLDSKGATPTQKIVLAEQRCSAQLECARVGVACELFRLREKRWPKSLDEIPNDLLPETPLDPYDGKRLRYRVLPDGIAVWSVGESLIEDPLSISEEDRPRVNMVFRLWNPDQRRRPAPPPKPEMLHTPDELDERKERD